MGWRRESGQASAEWIGLMLLVSLALGGALAVAREADFGGGAHDLGGALAGGLVCAARDACRAEAAAVRELGGEAGGGVRGGEADGGARGGEADGGAPRGGAGRARGVHARHLRSWTSASPDAFGGRGIRPSAPWEPAPRGLRGLEGASRSVRRALGRAGAAAGEFGWLACLGYRQWRYDYEHPRGPRESMPVDAVLNELNECFNPVGWLLP
jgi:hypothetical protein